ncbi:MAG: hypothetical protein KAY37_02460 [Phycisphaerae bacterium]|nr:hypothetical protein [Phycisphaerae bacterium]
MAPAADQNPERKRRARHAAAPDSVGPVAHARGSDRELDLQSDDEVRIVEEATQ